MSRLAHQQPTTMTETTFEEEEESTEEQYVGQHPMLAMHNEFKLKIVENEEDHLQKYTEVRPFEEK